MKILVITGMVVVILCIGAYKLIDKIFEEIDKWDKE